MRLLMNDDGMSGKISGRQTAVIWTLLLAGVAFRIVQWASGLSVDPDEAALALNILTKSYSELFGTLDYFQSQPVGYLITLKFVSGLLGSSEWAFRFVSLLAGCASLFLFVTVARKHLDFLPLAIVTAFLVLSDQLIVYSAQIRPYSLDLLIATGILNFYCDGALPGSSRKDCITFSLTGAAAVWFSFPSLFIYCSFGAVSLSAILRKRKFRAAVSWLLMYLPIVLSFCLYYFINLREISGLVGKHTEEMRPESYLPFPITSYSDFTLYFDKFLSFFNDPVGISLQALGAFLFLCGMFSLCGKDRKKLFLLLMPIVFTLIAIVSHKYLTHARRMHFLVPFVLLVIGEGIGFLRESMSGRRTALGILLFMMLFNPVLVAGRHLFVPRISYAIKPALDYAKQNWRPGDRVYVTWRAATAAEYYIKRGLVNKDDIIVAPAHKDINVTVSRLNELRQYERVWLLHADSPAGDRERMQAFLDMSGRLVHQKDFGLVLVQLYVFPKRR